MGYIPSSPTFPAVLGDELASGYNFSPACGLLRGPGTRSSSRFWIGFGNGSACRRDQRADHVRRSTATLTATSSRPDMRLIRLAQRYRT